MWPMAGGSTAPGVGCSSMSSVTRPSSRACPCRTRRGATASGCGCSIRAGGSSARWTSHAGCSSPSASVPAMRGGWPFTGTMRWWDLPCPAEPHLRGARARCGARGQGRGGAHRDPRHRSAHRGYATLAAAHRRHRGALRCRGAAGVVRPMALGFRSDEVQRLITVGPGALFQFTK